MCLCLGTSLSGMNADRMAESPAKKSLYNKAVIGTVLINIQQTPLDELCTIRVWAKIDDAFKILCRELNLDQFTTFIPPTWPEGEVFEVPYDKNGHFSNTEKTVLNLKIGAKVRICAEGAANEGATGKIDAVRGECWTIELNEEKKKVYRVFGKWWIEAALRGGVKQLPLVNI